ncbi:MAG TPA: hypothetical protein VGH81_04395 [Rudaea sp.]|jgi:hypothetical protein
MNAVVHPSDRSWFRTAAGRHFGLEIALIVLAKAALLTLLYFSLVASQPRADTSPAAMRARVLSDIAGNATTEPATP